MPQLLGLPNDAFIGHGPASHVTVSEKSAELFCNQDSIGENWPSQFVAVDCYEDE
jgi:hypothetical protein